MKKNILNTLLIATGILYSGCSSSSTHDCGTACVESKILKYSECEGFSDRNGSAINFSNDNTYVEYNLNKAQEILTITHYNVATACENNNTSTINTGWLNYINIGYIGNYNKDCYCLRDIKTELKFKQIQRDINGQYPIQIEDRKKSELDPKISFVINLDKNTSGVVSFSRTSEPWIMQ
jgi:hypothetical protein